MVCRALTDTTAQRRKRGRFPAKLAAKLVHLFEDDFHLPPKVAPKLCNTTCVSPVDISKVTFLRLWLGSLISNLSFGLTCDVYSYSRAHLSENSDIGTAP